MNIFSRVDELQSQIKKLLFYDQLNFTSSDSLGRHDKKEYMLAHGSNSHAGG